MKPTREYTRKLNALVRSIAPDGRALVRALIQSVLDAGGVSEQALVAMIRTPGLDTDLRANVAWLIPRLAMTGASGELRALLSDPSERVRAEAAVGLGLLPSSDEAVDALVAAAAADSSTTVRIAALHGLGILSSPRSAGPVLALLRDAAQPDEIRADAAESLAHVEDDAVVPALVDALADPSPLVRYSAAYALGEQRDPAAIPALGAIAAGDDGDTPFGRVSACAREAIETIEGRDS